MMTSFHPMKARIRPMRSAQRGVVLFIALIVLVAMTLAGLGMMRSVDTNNLIAGNLAFKNAATSAADAAIEIARNQLQLQTAGQLNIDGPGYFANWQPSFDPKTFNWEANATPLADDGFQNVIYYVIHRMCAQSGVSIDGTDCAKVTVIATGSTKGGTGTPLSSHALAFYRITARVQGPKFTVSYVQAFVY